MSLRTYLRKAFARLSSPPFEGRWSPQLLEPTYVLGTDERPDTSEEEGSRVDLQERLRGLAFEMYGDALVRMAAEDAQRHRDARRESA